MDSDRGTVCGQRERRLRHLEASSHVGVFSMPGLESEIDAIFYQLIHRLAGTAQDDQDAERRGQSRKPFRLFQRIAPWRGPGFPDDAEFFDVPCHDLTRGGFSFFLPARPNFASLVAEFGSPAQLIFVAAQVTNYRRVLLHPSGLIEHVRRRADGRIGRRGPDGQKWEPCVLVGCRFTQRLERP
jgi:hypothetical protein